jgi:hypothetical protein
LAALKRCGEEDWKKRVLPVSSLNDDASANLPASATSAKPMNIIKLQQEQIKQQLQNITPKPLKSVNTSDLSQRSNNILAGGVVNSKRNVLTPVNSNTANIVETTAPRYESNESLDSIDLDKQQRPKRHTFVNPSDTSNNGSYYSSSFLVYIIFVLVLLSR